MTTADIAEPHLPICQKCGKPVTGFVVEKKLRRGVRYAIEVRCHGEVDRFEYYPLSPQDEPFEPKRAFPTDRPAAVGTAPTGPATHAMDVQEELLAMAEWQTLARLQHFNTSIALFRRNAGELVQFLDLLTKDARTFHLSDVRKSAALDIAMGEVLRLLHNFAASAQSLVDHSRVLFTDLYGEGNFPDYEQKKKEQFIENPLIQFVHCLRQFAQHYRLPHISYVLNATRETEITRRLVLQKDDLLKFKGWNAGGKKYLAGAAPQIDLHQVVVAYEKTIREFYEWVQTRQKQIHAADITKVEAKQAEARHLPSGSMPQSRTSESGLRPFHPSWSNAFVRRLTGSADGGRS